MNDAGLLAPLTTLPLPLWWTLLGALAFALFSGVASFIVMRRARSIENIVARRTAELAQINEKLAEEICDHLNTEHALDKERESLKAVLNNLHESILVLDAVGQLRIANGAAFRLYRQIKGTELHRLDDFSMTTLLGLAPNPKLESPELRALRGENVRDLEFAVVAFDGSELTLRINGQPLYTSDGRQHGAILVIRDITDGKKIERLKSEFVATVSHELRTPITSIRGSLGLIAAGATGALPEKTQSLVDIALRNSERLAQLINDLLDMEKIESGKMHFETARHSMQAIVETALESNAAYAQNYGVQFKLIGMPEPVEAIVDPLRILQVLANLLSNAAKFSPRGATVEVRLSASDDRVRVSVRDSGPGIAPDFRSRLFQKFSQADSSDARGKSGTGLGLAISKAMVEAQNGTIGVDSVPGFGSTFFFELPIARVAASAASNQLAQPTSQLAN